MKPVLIIEVPGATTAATAERLERRVVAATDGDYHVLIVPAGVTVYEVGRWLWQRALRRRKARPGKDPSL